MGNQFRKHHKLLVLALDLAPFGFHVSQFKLAFGFNGFLQGAKLLQIDVFFGLFGMVMEHLEVFKVLVEVVKEQTQLRLLDVFVTDIFAERKFALGRFKGRLH